MSDDDTPRGAASGQDVRDSNFRRALSGLADLSIGAYQLPEMLTHVAEFAVQAIPNADGVGVTLQHGTKTDVIVASTHLVSDVDDVQYSVGEGPCITAAATGRTVRSGSLDTETRWPRFSSTAGKLGVHSVLSLPLIVGQDKIIGAMNVYSLSTDAFDDGAVRIGESFATPAAMSVQNARALADAVSLAQRLEKALRARSSIDRAVGILMSRTGCTPDKALDELDVVGRREGRTAEDVAESVVEEAITRAQSRPTDT